MGALQGRPVTSGRQYEGTPIDVQPQDAHGASWCIMLGEVGRGVLREERSKALLPERDGRTHLVHVRMPVIDGCDARDGPVGVIKQAFRNVWRNGERSEIGRKSAAEVVERPIMDAGELIELLDGITSAGWASL
jgi:hypothetical protein